MTQKQKQPMSDVIDVFSADCPLCVDAILAVEDAVQACGCTVRERPWEEGPQQVQYSEGGAYPVAKGECAGRPCAVISRHTPTSPSKMSVRCPRCRAIHVGPLHRKSGG